MKRIGIVALALFAAAASAPARSAEVVKYVALVHGGKQAGQQVVTHGDDGVTRMVRACADGPVLRGDRVRWGDLGTIPFDALGAPRVLNVTEGGSQ